MTSTAPPVQLDWCDHARAILKLKKPKLRNLLKQAPEKELKIARQNIDARLGQLKSISEETVWGPFDTRYARLVTQVEAKLGPVESATKADITEITDRVHDLHALADELKDACTAAAETKAKVDAFERTLREAKRDMAILEVQKGNTVNLKRYLKVAEDHGVAGRYPEADAGFEKFQEELVRQQKALKKLDATRLEQLSLEPEYSLKYEELQARWTEIKDLPGINDTVAKFEAVMERGQQKAALGDYTAGIAELAKGDQLPSKADCARLSDEALAAFEASNADADGAWDAAQRALAGLKAVAVPEEVKVQQVQVTRLGDQMVGGSAESAAALAQLTARMVTRTGELQRMQTEAAKALRMSIGTLKTLREYAGLEIVAPFAQRLEFLQTTLTSGRIEGAYEPSLELDRELVAAAADYNQRQSEWAAAQSSRVTPLGQKVAEMIADCPPAAQRARVLKGQLDGLVRFATVDPKDPVGAIDRLDRLESEADDLNTIFEQYQAVAVAREAAEEARTEFEQSSKAALNGLRAAIAQARTVASSDGTSAFVPFDQNCADLLDRWRRAIDSALTAPALKTPAFTTQAATVLKSIADAGQGGALDQAVSEQEQDEARRRYETDRTVLVRELDRLSAFDDVESDKLMASLLELDKRADKDYAMAGVALAKLNSSSGKKLARAQQLRDATKAALDQSKADVEQMMAKLKKAMKDKAFQPFVENLETELVDMGGMLTTNNINTMNEASTMLLALKTRMRQMLIDMKADGAANFNAASATIKALGKKLGDDSGNAVYKALTECAGATLQMLQKRFESAKEDAYTQLPSESIKTLQALDKDVEDAAAVATTAKAVRDTFALELKLVKAKVKQFDKSHPFLVDVATRLAKLEEQVTKEGQEARAQDGLMELKIELNQAMTDTAYLFKLDEKASAKSLKAEQDAVLWEKRLQQFQKVDYGKAKAAIKAASGDGTLIDELDRMITSMKQLAKAGSYDDANQQLVFAKQRVREIVKRPEGPTIGSRNDLPKDLTVFKKAVRSYNDAMRAFPGAVRALEEPSTPVPPASHSAIERLTSKVQSDINESAFDKLVATLSKKETDRNKRRAARESALSLIRTYQSRLKTSKTMSELITNPIERQEIPRAMSGMYYALNRLEGNVLRCCK